MTTPTIYLCDDDEGVRSSIAFLLRQHDLNVLTYASGPELLAALDAWTTPQRGIFVLDVRMEPLSGLQVHDALISRGLGTRMPVLFLSGHGDIPMAVAAMAKGPSILSKSPMPTTRWSNSWSAPWNRKCSGMPVWPAMTPCCS